MRAPSAPPTGGLPPLAALAAVAAVLGTSAIFGRCNAPDRSHPGIWRWYARLDKPGFTPPDPVFAATWPVLEAGFAVGGYRLLRHEPSPRRNASVGLWLATSAMIGGWTQIFFRERALATGATTSGAMLASTAAFVATSGKVDRVARATAIPLLGWLAFATVLATGVWRRNRPGASPR